MSRSEEHLRDLLPAYALGALEPEERERVEAYLAQSAEARRELADLMDAAAALGAAFPQVPPPPALRERLLAQIRMERRQEPRPRDRAGLWPVAFAVAASLVIVLGGLAYTWRLRLVALEERLARQEQVVALLTSPGVRAATLEGPASGRVRLIYDPRGRQGALLVSDLRDPGAGFVYQLWLIADGRADSAGVFRPAPGRPLVLPLIADFARYQIVAVTVERGPSGVQRSANPPVLTGRL
jgi:anti-sigma-K factor RskA